MDSTTSTTKSLKDKTFIWSKSIADKKRANTWHLLFKLKKHSKMYIFKMWLDNCSIPWQCLLAKMQISRKQRQWLLNVWSQSIHLCQSILHTPESKRSWTEKMVRFSMSTTFANMLRRQINNRSWWQIKILRTGNLWLTIIFWVEWNHDLSFWKDVESFYTRFT